MKSDVLVVGAGPAGLATAIAAAANGLRVMVADARRPPINKPCGEGLLPEAVDTLRSIGIELDSSLGCPLKGFRFSDDTYSISAPIERGRAFGLRRTALHNLLVAKAAEVGVIFRWGVRVSDFAAASARINGEFVGYRWLVGADGLNSSVRRWAKFNWPRIKLPQAVWISSSFRDSTVVEIRRSVLGKEVSDGRNAHPRGRCVRKFFFRGTRNCELLMAYLNFPKSRNI